MTCLTFPFSPHVAFAAGLPCAPMTANDAAATSAAATSVLFMVLPLASRSARELPAGNETHALVHQRERGRRCRTRLLGAAGKQAGELRVVVSVLVVPRLDRLEQRDHGVGDVSLELPVAAAVVAGLDRLGVLPGR